MEILHVSAECYPMAKVGGLADVVGALPKYQAALGHIAKVVMPMHRTKFLMENEWDVVHKGAFHMGRYYYDFTIIKERANKLGFDLYCVDIYGLLDREKVYGYNDDTERFVAFQIAVLEWLSRWKHHPDMIHVHDHHTALIPFMMKYCYAYEYLRYIPVVLTIHNAQYQGWMGWDKSLYIPSWDTWRWGLLDWSNTINSLACGIKCADKVNTVSPGYLSELMHYANGLENLFNYEMGKCSGIINGIDYEVWNPATDPLLIENFSIANFEEGKQKNKAALCKEFNFDENLPLFIFIGRLVNEKAADLLPGAIQWAFAQYGERFCFLVLGSGEPGVEYSLQTIRQRYAGFYNTQIKYNEKLSHQMYAGADFLLMPSRIEPCGLNQMYAMRYGTVPVVRRTGGLKDTVIDYGDPGGYGICFNNASMDDMVYSIGRGIELFNNKDQCKELQERMMNINLSWEASAEKYLMLYHSVMH